MKSSRFYFKVILSILIFAGLVWLMLLRFFYLEKYSYVWEDYFYLWLLIILMYGSFGFKIGSRKVLRYSIYSYILGFIFVLFNLNNFGEFFLRSSFIGLIVGLTSALVEYRKIKQ